MGQKQTQHGLLGGLRAYKTVIRTSVQSELRTARLATDYCLPVVTEHLFCGEGSAGICPQAVMTNDQSRIAGSCGFPDGMLGTGPKVRRPAQNTLLKSLPAHLT